jgi:hypothetical protein
VRTASAPRASLGAAGPRGSSGGGGANTGLFVDPRASGQSGATAAAAQQPGGSRSRASAYPSGSGSGSGRHRVRQSDGHADEDAAAAVAAAQGGTWGGDRVSSDPPRYSTPRVATTSSNAVGGEGAGAAKRGSSSSMNRYF